MGVLICHLTRLVGWSTMARLLPVLAALSPYSVFSHNGGVKHVLEGEEYGISSRQDKSISARGFGNDVAEDKFKECFEPKDSTSFHDFKTEECLLLRPRICRKGFVGGKPCLLLRLHPAVLFSQCTHREVRGQALQNTGLSLQPVSQTGTWGTCQRDLRCDKTCSSRGRFCSKFRDVRQVRCEWRE